MAVEATMAVITVAMVAGGEVVGRHLQWVRLLEWRLQVLITGQLLFTMHLNTSTHRNLKLLHIAQRMVFTIRKLKPAQVAGNGYIIKY
jgi:hypothetical protein